MTEPLTARGRRTRGAIVRGARVAFAERGFHGTRVADIAAAAELSVGTFYRYFEDKQQLLERLIPEIGDEVYGDFSTPRSGDGSPRAVLTEANLLYLRSFQRHRDYWQLLGEAALTVPAAKQALAERRHYHQGRARRGFNRWQSEGLIDIDVDIDAAAAMLGAMAERSAYIWFVFGEAPDVDAAAEHLTTLWLNTLGIAPGA